MTHPAIALTDAQEAYMDAWFDFLSAEGCPCEDLNPHQKAYIAAWVHDSMDWPEQEQTADTFNQRAFSELEIVRCLDPSAIELRIDRLHRLQAERKQWKTEKRKYTYKDSPEVKRAKAALERSRREPDLRSPLQRLFPRY